jgi:1-acyl-sn-glycerol-3-phosphate acyltransferase
MAYRRGDRVVTFVPPFAPFTIIFHCTMLLVGAVARTLFGLRIKGARNLREVDRAILVSNHTLVLDPGFLGYSLLPRRAYCTMLEETALIPVLGTFTRLLGAIPLVRGPGALKRQERGFDDAIRHLGLLGFFPEGECYLRNQQVMPFHRGAFHVACRRGLPVVPIAIVLKQRASKICQRLRMPPRILMVIGKPLHPTSPSRSAEEDLSSRAREAIQSVIDREGGCKTMGRGAMPRLALHEHVMAASVADKGSSG